MKMETFFLLTIYVFQMFPSLYPVAGESRNVNNCIRKLNTTNTLNICLHLPSNLTEYRKYNASSRKLKIGNSSSLDCNKHEGWTQSVDAEMQSLQNISKSECTRNFRSISGVSWPIPAHFASDGTFFNGSYYFRKDSDYQIQSCNSKSITLLLRPENLTTDIFIPKCCAWDEVFYRNRTCSLLLHNQRRWKPELFLKEDVNRFKPFEYNTTALKFYSEDLFTKCDFLNFTSFHWWSPTGMGTVNKDFVRLTVINDGVRNNVIPLVLDPHTRKWGGVTKNTPFCVDGTYLHEGPKSNRRHYYAGNSEDFVLYFCGPPFPERQLWKTWVYLVSTFVSSVFLLFTFVVYSILIKSQNFYGLTVLMFSIAMFLQYTFTCVAYIISLLPNSTVNHIENGSWPCKSIAIGKHIFSLATFMWLTVMNANFMWTFARTEIVRRQDKKLKIFWICSLIAWGFPCALVGSFVAIDHIFEDPVTEVPVPRYGHRVCDVARPFRGHYSYAPNGILIFLNLLLIAFTFRIFLKAKTERCEKLVTWNSRISQQTEDFTFVFFLKLFWIMGGTKSINLLTWYYHEDQSNGYKPVWVVVLETINYLKPVVLFLLFCLNKRIKTLLAQRFKL